MRRVSSRLAAFLIAIGLVLPVTEPRAGEITNCFTPGSLGTCKRKVLQHVKFKSTVTEFVDPQDTGIGHSLSRVLWREILESIHDLSGAGVILAHDAHNQMADALQGRDYLEFLENDYHMAAIRIAEGLETQMSVWGVVLEAEGDVLFEPFLTLLPAKEDPWTAVRLRSERYHVSAEIPHRRLNFAPLTGTREELFRGTYLTRCALSAGCPDGVAIRDGPSNDSPIVERASVGGEIRVRDMKEQWLEVERPGGGRGYINLYHIEITPRQVFTRSRRGVNIRAEPQFGPNVLGKDDLGGLYEVLAVRRHASGEFWYRIRTERYEGWTAGRLFQRYYSMPMVHFIAGLYRYARGEYKGAVREFETFIARSQDEDNVTRAAAHQFLAASRIAYHPGQGGAARLALKDLDRAVRLTPFDPAAYTLRSVVTLGAQFDPQAAFEDMLSAARLDPSDSGTIELLTEVREIVRRQGWEVLTLGKTVNPRVADSLFTVPLGGLD